MNYLAHLYLSRFSDEMMVGNFIADAVKGRKYREYAATVSRGILMHRAIDTFTDTSSIVAESKSLLRPKYGLYSSILVDLFYDYFLARNWNRYSEEPLGAFAQNCYRVLEGYYSIMPQINQHLFPYMKKENWLVHYAGIEGIRRSLYGMSRRLQRHPGIEHAWVELKEFEAGMQEQFFRFFPQLQAEVSPFMASFVPVIPVTNRNPEGD